MPNVCDNDVNRYPTIKTWAGTLRLVQKSDLDPKKQTKSSDVAELANELIDADFKDKEPETPKTKQDKKAKRPANTPPTSAEKLEARKRVNSLWDNV